MYLPSELPAYEDIAEGTRYKQWRVNCACQLFEAVSDGDSLDWKEISAQEIAQRVTSKVGPGSIVLFHNAALHTPEALPTILEQLTQEGYTFVPSPN